MLLYSKYFKISDTITPRSYLQYKHEQMSFHSNSPKEEMKGPALDLVDGWRLERLTTASIRHLLCPKECCRL